MVALSVEYEGEVVALSAGMAFLGCFSAVSLMEQYRLSTVKDRQNGSLVLMAFVSATLAGVAIWCLHFVASCSFRLKHEGVEIPLRFNVKLLICALVVNFVIQFISIYIGSTDSCFNKSKKEIIESFISRASSSYTMSQIRNIGKYKLLILICTHNLYRVVIGGMFSGIGCTLVIYLGFMSMEFQGTIKYHPGLVVLTTILSTIFATNGFVTFVRVLSLFPSMDSVRLGIAFNSLFFMTGMHYIGLTSATFEYDSSKAPPSADTTIGQHKLLLGTLAAAVLFSVCMHIFVVSDLRAWLLSTSTQLRQADVVIDALYQHNCTHNSFEYTAPANRELLRYVRRYNQEALAQSSTGDNTHESVPYMHRHSLYNDYSDDEEVTGTSSVGYSHHHSLNDGMGTPNTHTRKKPSIAHPQTESNSSSANLSNRGAAYIVPDTINNDVGTNNNDKDTENDLISTTEKDKEQHNTEP